MNKNIIEKESIITKIIEKLEDNSALVRTEAIKIIGRLTTSSLNKEKMLSKLLKGLEDNSALVRIVTIRQIETIDKDTLSKAESKIKLFLNSNSPYIDMKIRIKKLLKSLNNKGLSHN